MKISSAFPSNYLKAPDLQGRDVAVVMAHVKIEEVGPEKDQLPVLYFKGKERGLVLNKTNASTIADVFGDDTENWTGVEITLYEAMVEYKGKMGPAIRVRVAPRRGNGNVQSRQQIPPPPPEPASSFEDDIPF